MTAPDRGERSYAAFISYSHENSDWAAWLHRGIERYRLPGRLASQNPELQTRLKPVFRDREELASASDLGEKITLALAASRALIVICSPASARSRWVQQEILEYKRQHGEENIFCLIVDGEPGSGDEHECFPPALKYRIGDDGVLTDQPVEPIAADVRPGKDGKTLARLKLIAGLLGVGLDNLRQRDQQRRNRRMLAITVASLAGMALTGYLAITAMVARDDAQRRQQQAEGLIEFMLGDLKKKLGEVGRLDALDATARRAVAYFSELPDKELDDQALARRAEAYRAIGEIHIDRFEWPQAQQICEMVVAVTRELQQRHPDDPGYLFDLGQSEFWLGYTHFEPGNLAAAEPHLQAYLAHSLALLEFDDANAEWVMEVSYAHSNLAALHDRAGDHPQSLRHAADGVAWNRKAVDLAPGDDWYREELIGGLDWLARAQMRTGQLRESAASRHAAAAIGSNILAADPENRQAQQQLAASLRGEAWPLNLLGEHDKAIARLDESLVHFQAITAHDPGNDLWGYWAGDAALDRVTMMAEAGVSLQIPPEELDLLEGFSARSYPDDVVRESRRLLAAGVLAVAHQDLAQLASIVRQMESLVLDENDGGKAVQPLAYLYLVVPEASGQVLPDPRAMNRALEYLREWATGGNNPVELSLFVYLGVDRGAEVSHVVTRLKAMGFNTGRFRMLGL